LKKLIIERKPLDIPIWKYIPHLTVVIKCLLIENKLLHHKVKVYKDVLGVRKIRKIGKRMKMKDAMMLSL
jgi:hypothetical protein